MATIVAVKLSQRSEFAPKFQEILSKYGCNIKTRIGLHDATTTTCSPDGIILLDVIGNNNEVNSLINELTEIKELIVKTIEI